jgi:antitoxin (DNA-binding transcriptional repressor) of toxin-antitoxin stability system
MPVHGIHYTKTHLSELVRMVEHGNVITITRNQAPVALLLRIGAVPQPRRSGSLRALMRIDPALDDAPAPSDDSTPSADSTTGDDGASDDDGGRAVSGTPASPPSATHPGP